MGYTHYWARPEQLNKEIFVKFAEDCKKIIQASEEMGINIAGGNGDGAPLIANDIVMFNGSCFQQIGTWTTSEHVSLAWPSDEAGINDPLPDPIADKTKGNWYAGTLVTQRVAPINNKTGKGSGDYETFAIEAYEEQPEYNKDKALVFNFTKTSYRPYDLTVTACLIAFKYHFGPQVKVSTDGAEKDWMDGRILCNNILGYGLELDIFAEPTEIPKVTPKPSYRNTRHEYGSLSEICKEIKNTIHKDFPGVKLLASRGRGSSNSFSVSVVQAPEELTECKTPRIQLNQFYMDRHNFTPYGKKLMTAIHDIIKKYHWDESDSMIDYFHCSFYYNMNIGEYNNPLKIVPLATKPAKQLEVKFAGIQIVDYSEKALAIIGDTKPIKETLKSLGGRFNAYLKCGAGWIFPKTAEQRIRTALNL